MADSSAAARPAALLESPVRRRIVDLLANLTPEVDPDGGEATLPGLSAGELAEQLDLHVTTVRFHLDQLVSAAVLTTDKRPGRIGRPRKIYRFRPGGLAPANQAEAFEALARLLAETWQVTEDGLPLTPEEAGRRWAANRMPADEEARPSASVGEWIGKVGRTVDLLAEWGYTPEMATRNQGSTAELTLVDCPFLALADDRPELVCGVHRGLLRGAMDAVGEKDTDISLTPFVGPRRCRATITTRATFDRPANRGGASASADETDPEKSKTQPEAEGESP